METKYQQYYVSEQKWQNDSATILGQQMMDYTGDVEKCELWMLLMF